LGFLLAGPIAGRFADRHGARPFATDGMIVAAASFLLLITLPVNFSYWTFGVLIFVNGFAMGLFAAPNQTGVMNSLPSDQRGAGAGMAGTFMNAAMVLSIGIFFSLIIIGLSSSLPATLYTGLVGHGVAHATAGQISHVPPVGTLFAAFLGYNPMASLLAAFLGYNPMASLLGPAAAHLPHATATYLTGHTFFPRLVAQPFASGIHTGFYFAAGCCALSAIASWLRGQVRTRRVAGPVEQDELAEAA
jgi:MFS family permease